MVRRSDQLLQAGEVLARVDALWLSSYTLAPLSSRSFVICPSCDPVCLLGQWRQNPIFDQRVPCAALANAALVLSSKNWKKYSRWGAASKNKSQSLGPTFSLCLRAGIDAALAKADFCFSEVHPPSKVKIDQKVQNTLEPQKMP